MFDLPEAIKKARWHYLVANTKIEYFSNIDSIVSNEKISANAALEKFNEIIASELIYDQVDATNLYYICLLMISNENPDESIKISKDNSSDSYRWNESFSEYVEIAKRSPISATIESFHMNLQNAIATPIVTASSTSSISTTLIKRSN